MLRVVVRVLAAAVLAAAAGLLAGAATQAPARAAAAQARARTVVTFTWGGGFANQLGALPAFRRYGMHATFYVPSGLVCTSAGEPGCAHSPYLTLSEVRQIAADGNEIGGLSVEHVPLDKLPAAEAEREICDDRVNLTNWGFQVTDFAYPFALVNHTLQTLAQRCGYNSGLGTGQLRGAGRCADCPWAETIPPANPYVLRTPIEVASVGTTWSPATFEQIVTGAQQHGGGWVIFTVHDVCARTCSLGVTRPELDSVLSWLSGQASAGVSVQTVRQVIGGPVRPAIPGPSPPAIPPPGVINSGLALVSADGTPACYQATRYGTNHATFSYRRHGGPGGDGAELISMTGWQSGTAQLLPALDLGQCSPTVTPGQSYQLSAWYTASTPADLNVYYRTALGTWRFWASSPPMAASSRWTRARWTTPAVPAGATALSFGLGLRSDGTLSVSRYSLGPGQASGSGPGPFGLVTIAIASAAVLVGAIVAAAAAIRRFRRRQSGQEAG
jgi:peptidoglycan/xylan/chitin deacetylase (PgdA/CDA1 family)